MTKIFFICLPDTLALTIILDKVAKNWFSYNVVLYIGLCIYMFFLNMVLIKVMIRIKKDIVGDFSKFEIDFINYCRHFQFSIKFYFTKPKIRVFFVNLID